MEWPPVFDTYDKFNSELKLAMVSCPGFTRWLRRGATGHEGKTVDELKIEYIKLTKKRLQSLHLKLVILEFEIKELESSDKYKNELDKLFAYNTSLNCHDNLISNGLVLKPPKKPRFIWIEKYEKMTSQIVFFKQEENNLRAD